jgi:hypoxanthine phosphoribosyltransferase
MDCAIMTEIMRCELISWGEVERLCQRLATQIKCSGYQPDIVIAIARGGYVPARLICDYLDLMPLTSIKIEHYLAGSSKQEQAVIRYPLCTDIKDKNVLLVDDVNDSGDTLRVAAEHLQSFDPRQVRIAVMHNKVVSDFGVDYYARKVVKWRWLIYPWAIQEDISNFLQRFSPSPATLEQAQQKLLQNFQIRISLRQLENIYALMESQQKEAHHEDP